MADTYDFRTTSVSVPTFPAIGTVTVLPNRNRVTIIFACSTVTSVTGAIAHVIGTNQVTVVGLDPPDTFTMSYRDFGPLVTEGFGFSCAALAANGEVSITEIIRIPRT